MLIFACLSVGKLILVCHAMATHNVSSDAISCPNGTFYSRDYETCVPCSTCDDYSTRSVSCRTASDTVCIKCPEVPRTAVFNYTVCKRCPLCKAGEYMVAKCTDKTRTVCRRCPAGSFNKLASYKTNCIPCTSCENRVMITDCTSSLDTDCGPCKKGYFKDVNRNQCNRCASCAPGQLPIEGCKNGMPGKLCSEYFFFRTQYVEVPSRNKTETVSALLTASSTISTLLQVSSNQPFSSSKSSEITSNDAINSVSLGHIVINIVVILVVMVIAGLLLAAIVRLCKRVEARGTNDETVVLFMKDSYEDGDEVLGSRNLVGAKWSDVGEVSGCQKLSNFKLSDPIPFDQNGNQTKVQHNEQCKLFLEHIKPS